jgi:hypothetical protein
LAFLVLYLYFIFKVEQMTKEKIIEMAKQVGFEEHQAKFDTRLEPFAKLVAQHEREACAEICDGFYLSWIDIQGRYEFMGEGASECAGAIRARGQA